jgi:UDP-N-acetyl-D-glucosamine dehydrogenase
MKVSIIGQGYVGLTIAVAAAGKGHEVTGFDMNSALVEQLNTGKSHIEGVESSLVAGLIKSGNYRATTSASDIAGSEIVVIAVPTPLDKERKPDLAFVESACKSIGENLDSAALIINESTSFPGTVRNLIVPTIEKYSKKKLNHLFAVSPERVDPGNEKFNQSNTPRLYAGLTPEASAKVRDFYSTFCSNMVEVSSPEVAEAAKLFENTFRQVNIALVNEFAQITNALGISVHETLDAAATKPYGFMKFNPSAGVGGHCIPVDPSYLAYVSAGLGVPATFIERANEVNLEMPKYVVARVIGDIGALKSKKVLVVGVAYKPNVADTRETPAELVIAQLKAEGAIVAWHDEVVGQWHGEKSAPLNGNYDAAIVVTLHKSLNVADVKASAPYVFDTTGKVPGVKGL